MPQAQGDLGSPVGAKPFRILSLDGGGAKGFYTLGVLKEVEALVAECTISSDWTHLVSRDRPHLIS